MDLKTLFEHICLFFSCEFFVGLLAGIILMGVLTKKFWRKRRYNATKIVVPFGIGNVHLEPNEEDLKIAHKIWVELMTRKSAIPIDSKNDVILEVYDSWYKLFKKVRGVIAEIPVASVYDNKDTKKLINISVKVLNVGLRPHLTKWQARYRHWHNVESQIKKNKKLSPQELQKKFPQYNELIKDMIKINKNLKKYADELKKITER